MNKYLVAVIVLLAGPMANAGFYIEPLVGYTQANIEYTFKPAFGGTSDKIGVTGLNYGAEAGWIFSNSLRLGVNYEMANLDFKYETAGTTNKNTATQIFFIVGYKFPQDIIGYAGIGSATSVDDQTPKTTLTGMVLKIGGAKQLIKHVQVNVEGVMWTWNESTTDGSAAIKISEAYEKFNAFGVQASLRFPLEIGGK